MRLSWLREEESLGVILMMRVGLVKSDVYHSRRRREQRILFLFVFSFCPDLWVIGSHWGGKRK